jgi:hypothetical protein
MALQEQRRPVLVHSHPDDRVEHVGFMNRARLTIRGGGAAIAVDDSGAYFAMSLRNVGAGIAVLQAWQAVDGAPASTPPTPVDGFRRLMRDQYIAAGDTGVCQGAVRDAGDPAAAMLAAAVAERRTILVDLLYTDQVGGQRTISRFGLLPEEEADGWLAAAGRHWYLDAAAPR